MYVAYKYTCKYLLRFPHVHIICMSAFLQRFNAYLINVGPQNCHKLHKKSHKITWLLFYHFFIFFKRILQKTEPRYVLSMEYVHTQKLMFKTSFSHLSLVPTEAYSLNTKQEGSGEEAANSLRTDYLVGDAHLLPVWRMPTHFLTIS